MGNRKLGARWFQSQAFQNAVTNAHSGHAPNDSLALARFGTDASEGGWFGKVARFRNPSYQRMMAPVLEEVQDRGHRSICGFAHGASHKQVADVFDRAATRKKAEDLAVARAKAMSGPFARKHRDVESGITDPMRRAWADAADKLERTRREEAILDESRVIPEFDWGGIIREEAEIRDAVREKYAGNPLGVSTGPG